MMSLVRFAPTIELPTIRVSEAGKPLSTPHADLLQYGFVLRNDAGTVDTNPPEQIHVTHGAFARDLLRAGSQVLGSAELYPEFEGLVFEPSSPRHVDGLDARYWQVHTTHATLGNDGTPLQSEMWLEGWHITDEEHEELVRAARNCALGVTATSSVQLDYLMDGQISIDGVLGRRAPDVYVGATAGPSETLVFPNGYAAAHDSKPGVLYAHSFRTVGDADGLYRVASLSKIQ